MTDGSKRQRDILICLCLALVTAAVYWPVRHFEFTNYDDDVYLTNNSNLRWGLTPRGLLWAVTTPLDQWMPVTWLARMTEYQLFGLNSGAHHLVNVLFHIVNAMLLYGVLTRMTRAPWRSASVAALFALHPLHVESVAWATGFKDLLSMCFGILTIWAYARYVEEFTVRGSRVRMHYVLTLFLFALAVMAKPMMVTLPCVLLLLDYWPLGRTRWTQLPAKQAVKTGTGQSWQGGLATSQLVKEKIPFFVLAAGASVLTYWGQRSFGAVMSLENLSPGMRVANALLAYVRYLGKTVWPTNMAFFYPLDRNVPAAAAIGVAMGLAGVTATVIWKAQRAPWLVTGWFWFLGTLVPVIGLVQVGKQSMADRYTYYPLVGLFIMLCWSVRGRLLERHACKVGIGVATGVILIACAAVSRVQAGYWKDSETLFYHALKATRGNWLAQYNLGVDLKRAGRVQEAVGHYEQALLIRPDFAEAHSNLGAALEQLGQVQEAIDHYERALQLKPKLAVAHYDLGVALERTGKRQKAIAQYEKALQLKPDLAEAHFSLGLAWKQDGRVEEAVGQYKEALRIKPDYVDAQINLGVALMQLGRAQEAIGYYESAVRVKPDNAELHGNLGVALAQAGRLQDAIGHYQRALRLKPDLVQAHYNLGLALVKVGQAADAIPHFEQVLRVKPDASEVHFNLGLAREQTGKPTEAIGDYEEALRIKPDYAEALNNLAWLLATLPKTDGGDPARAVTLAERSCELTGNRLAPYLDTLAAAYAAAGRFNEAISAAQKGIELARAAGQSQVAGEIEAHLALYRAGHVYRR